MRVVNVVRNKDARLGYDVYDAQTGKLIEGVLGIFVEINVIDQAAFLVLKKPGDMIAGHEEIEVGSINGLPINGETYSEQED